MPVAVVARQQPHQRVHQILVGTGAGLDNRNAGRSVRDEHVAQAIIMGGAEGAHGVGEIDNAATRGVHIQHIGIHPSQPTVGRANLPIH